MSQPIDEAVQKAAKEFEDLQDWEQVEDHHVRAFTELWGSFRAAPYDEQREFVETFHKRKQQLPRTLYEMLSRKIGDEWDWSQ